MTFSIIVKYFNAIKDVLSGFIPTLVVCVEHPLGFQTAEKTLGHRIIPAIPLPAHAADHCITSQHGLKVIAAILATTVRVKDQPRCWLSASDGHA